MKHKKVTYKDSGVDIVKGDRLVQKIKKIALKSSRDESIGTIGGFGSFFQIPKKYKNPILVSSTDGIGTKLKIAFIVNKHDTIGIDLVAMCVNDIIVSGAEPLFFLDYLACNNLDINKTTKIIQGISKGCIESGCSLVGGETAEMPGIYNKNEYDLAGFVVGAVEKKSLIDGSRIKNKDIIIGIESNGVHSNGFSLIRKILEKKKIKLDEKYKGEKIYNLLMKPTKIYVKPVLDIIQKIDVKGIAHITGGGIIGNIPRILKSSKSAVIKESSWTRPKVYSWIKETNLISELEMLNVFNCGIGMILVIDKLDEYKTLKSFEKNNLNAFVVGEIMPQKKIKKRIVIE